MTNIDPKTGLPALPNGQFFRVLRTETTNFLRLGGGVLERRDSPIIQIIDPYGVPVVQSYIVRRPLVSEVYGNNPVRVWTDVTEDDILFSAERLAKQAEDKRNAAIEQANKAEKANLLFGDYPPRSISEN